jgi:hypothetical protein
MCWNHYCHPASKQWRWYIFQPLKAILSKSRSDKNKPLCPPRRSLEYKELTSIRTRTPLPAAFATAWAKGTRVFGMTHALGDGRTHIRNGSRDDSENSILSFRTGFRRYERPPHDCWCPPMAWRQWLAPVGCWRNIPMVPPPFSLLMALLMHMSLVFS